MFDRAGQGCDGGGPSVVGEFIMNSSYETMTSAIALDGLRPGPLFGAFAVGRDGAACRRHSLGADPRCPSAANHGRGVRSVGPHLTAHLRPQGELVPQERVLPHSVQLRIVLLAVDLAGIDPVRQVFAATQERPMKFCRLFVGRGCVRGYWCSFAHAGAELHPLAPDLKHQFADEYGGWPRHE